jgi:hypothetical protein
MRKLKMLLLLITLVANSALAQTIGDINNDGQVGLPEALNALQISAGMRTAYSSETYDLAEYLGKPNRSYLYEEISSSGKGTALMTMTEEYVDGQWFVARNIKSGILAGNKDYFRFSSSDVLQPFFFNTNLNNKCTFTPPLVTGKRNMKVGDVFYNFVRGDGPGPAPGTFIQFTQFREYVLIGLEDVTVKAGSFPGCLKLLQKREGGLIYLVHLAKDVGVVKHFSASTGNYGFTDELVAISQGDSMISPVGASICSAEGTWAEPQSGKSGAFCFYFDPQTKPIFTTISLSNLSWVPSLYPTSVSLVSQDGASFSNINIYSPSEITLVNGVVTGTVFVYGGFTLNLSGAYSCKN